MRNTIMALIVAVTFVTGEINAATPKPPPADVGVGRVAWFDISTSNLPRSREFYEQTDIQAICKKATTLAGTVVPDFPFNLPDGVGAICLVVDPVGRPIGMHSRTLLSQAPSPAK